MQFSIHPNLGQSAICQGYTIKAQQQSQDAKKGISNMQPIMLIKAALDDTPTGDIILRGVVHPDSLHLLKTGDYQREVLPQGTIDKLAEAIKIGAAIPTIELGARGSNYSEKDGVYCIPHDTYIIDGLQRVTAALQCLQKRDTPTPNIGAAVYFGTSEEWERERFRIVNYDRTKLSSNILLRNLRQQVDTVELMIRLCDDPKFSLYKRVCWSQRQSRSELISAISLARVVGIMHSHLGPTRSGKYPELASGLERVMHRIGKNIFRENIKVLFDLVDECWGLRRVVYSSSATQVKLNFLIALAEVLSGHEDFWHDNRLVIEPAMRKKIASFPVTDPQVQHLAGSAGKAKDMLTILIIEHINKGKRTGQLKSRRSFDLTDNKTEIIDLTAPSLLEPA